MTNRATFGAARALDNAEPACASSSLSPATYTRTRTRPLWLLLIPPSFFPAKSTPHHTRLLAAISLPRASLRKTPRSRVYRQTPSEPASSCSAWRGQAHLRTSDGRHADVAFVDIHGVKHTLHAYTERLLRVRGREIVVFRKSDACEPWRRGGR